MFGIGMPELMLIFVLALLVFGPKELPKIARTLGKAMAELRRASDELRDGIQREIDLATREEEKPTSSPESVATATHEEPASPAPTEQPSHAGAGGAEDASVSSPDAPAPVAPPEASASAPEGHAATTGTGETGAASAALTPLETAEPMGSSERPRESPQKDDTPSPASAQPVEIRNV
jgi:Tat protein translocase TatB subunit